MSFRNAVVVPGSYRIDEFRDARKESFAVVGVGRMREYRNVRILEFRGPPKCARPLQLPQRNSPRWRSKSRAVWPAHSDEEACCPRGRGRTGTSSSRASPRRNSVGAGRCRISSCSSLLRLTRVLEPLKDSSCLIKQEGLSAEAIMRIRPEHESRSDRSSVKGYIALRGD